MAPRRRVKKLSSYRRLPSLRSRFAVLGTGIFMAFLLGSTVLLIIASSRPTRDPASFAAEGAYPPSCQFWCAGCGGFCGDDGVRQGKTCNQQQFERCGQLPCYQTVPYSCASPQPESGSPAHPDSQDTGENVVLSTDCTCDDALCGQVYDNTQGCFKALCTRDGWKDIGDATHPSCDPTSADNGTCGDGYCSNGESAVSCARDCQTTRAPTNAQTETLVTPEYNSAFFQRIAQFYGLNRTELYSLFTGGVRRFLESINFISPQTQQTQPAQPPTRTQTPTQPPTVPRDTPSVSTPTPPANQSPTGYKLENGECVPVPPRTIIGMSWDQCMQTRQESQNPTMYKLEGRECVQSNTGTLTQSQCLLLIPL